MNIHIAQPRDTVRVTLPDSIVLEGIPGTTAGDFLRAHRAAAPTLYPAALMGAVFDGRLRELSYPITRDGTLRAVLASDPDGARIYRRSLILLLTAALNEAFPAVRVNLRYAVPDGGYYCTLSNRPPFSGDELARLEAQMRAIVAADAPITKRTALLTDVTGLYAARGEDDKVRLLEQRTRSELTLYKLREREDYYYGYMLPSAGDLQYFRLVPVDDGFILQYPRADTPEALHPIFLGKIAGVFHQADMWLDLMGVSDIGQLNALVRADRAHEIMLVAEALHEQQIAAIAHAVLLANQQRGVRLVFIAGPSSSGKTTFARRLAIQLLAHGIRPFTVEMDNYFVDRDRTPRDENGDYDFEALDALDRTRFNRDLLALMDGEPVQLPRFDFKKGTSTPDRVARLGPKEVIICEGIHGLNPDLVPHIPPDRLYRIYVSALTPLNIDSHNRISSTDLRVLRRIVRDARTRGYNAADTLNRWQSVRRGERRNIFPFLEYADSIFNSSLVYEIAALRPYAEPLLLQVEPGTAPHIEANRLLSFLRWVQTFSPSQMAFIPKTSLLREFIGGAEALDYANPR